MSVIADALKAAQRERARRESQGASLSSVAPVLIPLRTPPKPGLNWPRIGMLSAAALLVVVASAVALMKSPAKSSLPMVPPLTSSIVTEALADSANRAGKPPVTATIPTGALSMPRAPQRVATRPAPALSTPAQQVATAVRQGAARSVATNATASAPGPEARSTGRLRIAVEYPRQPEAARLFAEAVAAHRAGDVFTARKLYDSVLVLTPADGDALNNLGVLLSSQHDYARALEVLRRAVLVTPRNAGVWNNIGTVYHEQGKSGDAIAAFRHALTIDPQHPGARIGLAQQFLAIHALGQAKELLDDVIATHPDVPEAHYTLGQVLELQGDRAGAIRSYGAFIKTAPPRLATHVELVRRRVDALNRGS